LIFLFTILILFSSAWFWPLPLVVSGAMLSGTDMENGTEEV
jgi:hypothetical protein